MQRSLAGERDATLVAREATLIGAHRRRFLGTLADERGLERPRITWRAGFFETADVFGAELDELLGLESARFLEELTVRAANGDDIARIVDRLPCTLKSFALVRRMSFDSTLTDLTPLVERLPRLETLVVCGRVVRLPPASRLRVLEIDAVQIRGEPDAFAGHPALERLAIGAREFPDPMPDLLARPPTRLTALALRELGRIGPPLLESLAASALGDQLVELELKNCGIDDDVACALAATRGLRKVTRLSIDTHDLDVSTIMRLQQRWPTVKAPVTMRYDPDEE